MGTGIFHTQERSAGSFQGSGACQRCRRAGVDIRHHDDVDNRHHEDRPPTRPLTRDSGSSNPPHIGEWVQARLGHCRTHRADFAACARSQSGLSLSRLTSSGTSGLDPSRMGRLRTWKTRPVLPPDGAGRKQLEVESENWERLTDAISRVLKMA